MGSRLASRARTSGLVIAVAALVIGTPGTLPAQQPAAPATAGAGDAPTAATTWRIDTSHSELTFRIRHLLTRVRGSFREWNGTLTGEPEDWSRGGVAVAIRTASIDTNNERRDNHLRSDDFFAADAHPEIAFRSARVERAGDRIHIHGDLTIRDVTRPVVLEGEYLGSTTDGQGRRRVAFEAETTVNRQDYGVSWNRAEAGGLLLGDDVAITIMIQAVEVVP
jgi:polyisoprenoid-binding protein YceI